MGRGKVSAAVVAVKVEIRFVGNEVGAARRSSVKVWQQRSAKCARRALSSRRVSAARCMRVRVGSGVLQRKPRVVR